MPHALLNTRFHIQLQDDRSGVTLSPSQTQDAELVEDGTKSAREPDRWFFAAERLAHAFPEWPWAMLRLACAHLLLEDADGALPLFEEARRLVQAPDEAFDEWLAQFRVKVEVGVSVLLVHVYECAYMRSSLGGTGCGG